MRTTAISPLSRNLAIGAILLTAISVVVNGAEALLGVAEGSLVTGAAELLDVVRDTTVPTWYSSVLLLFAAVFVWQVARLTRTGRGANGYRFHLLGLVAGFVYISVDETVRIHERLNEPLREGLDVGGALGFAWVVVAIPLVVALAAVYGPWLVSLPRQVRRLVVVGGAVFVIGAVGLEMVGAALLFGGSPLAAGVVAHGEEFGEMLGLVIFIEAMMRYLNHLGWDGALRFDSVIASAAHLSNSDTPVCSERSLSTRRPSGTATSS